MFVARPTTSVLVAVRSHTSAHIGHWVRGRQGREGGRGQIVEILGAPGYEHFQIRWNENHELMVFSNEEVRIIPARSGLARDRRG